MEYFMTVHDKDYLSRKMVNMFVGVGEITGDLNNTIICRNLDFNLERYPSLCAFTSWYAISKNRLYLGNKICLVEYDVELSGDFYDYHDKTVAKYVTDSSIASYSFSLVDHYVFYKSTPYLEISLKMIYGIDLGGFMNSITGDYMVWPTTTNVCLSSKILNDFVEWFLPIAELIGSYTLGSYVHERAFFIFCVLNNIKINYITRPILKHKQSVSHGNLDIYGTMLQTYETTILTKSMKLEYDNYYSTELALAYENILQDQKV